MKWVPSIYLILVILYISYDPKIKNFVINKESNNKLFRYLKKIVALSSVSRIDLIKHSMFALAFLFCFYFVYSSVLYSFGINISLTLLFLIPVLIVLLTLPISIQGIGVREFVLLYWAGLSGIDPELVVSASILILILGIVYRLFGFIPFLILKKED